MREALRRLEAEKLVTIIPNKGPSVAVIGWADVEEIYGVRVLLEGEAAALGASRASAEDLEKMRIAVDDLAKAVSNHDPAGGLRRPPPSIARRCSVLATTSSASCWTVC
jgi:GntR family transcriptional regulator, trigonelline degradation regulator